MNKQAVRITQFVINSILTFVSFTSAILGFLLFVPLALAILFGLLLKNWSFFWPYCRCHPDSHSILLRYINF